MEGARTSGSRTKSGAPRSPDIVSLQQLKRFFKTNEILDENESELVELVQERRNVIHAYKNAEIGTGDEFECAVRGYLRLLRNLNIRLPYPH